MQVPNPKTIPVYVPKFVRVGLGLALALLYDGRVFDDFPGRCQRCGSRRCIRMGFLESCFARLILEDSFMELKVRRQRYYCKDCGKAYTSRGPFYQGADYGAPIVDLVLMLSMSNSSYGVESAMMSLGLQIDSDSVLDYTRRFADRCRELAPLLSEDSSSLYGINLLRVLFGVSDARELGQKLPRIDLESLADETYLRKKRALRKFVEEVMGSKEKRIVHRGLNAGRDIVIDKKDGKVAFPESFTLALSYLPGAEAYASLICTPQPFNEILAEVLFRALVGSLFTVTDGSRCYDEAVKNRVRCTVHKVRSELKKDRGFRELRKMEKEGRASREEVRSYARAKYARIVQSTLEELKTTHPEYFDRAGNFIGHTTTNGWREATGESSTR